MSLRDSRFRYVLREINSLLKRRPPPTFDGWLMTTHHQVPWLDDKVFVDAAEALWGFERSDAPSSPAEVDALMWRHWHVAYSVRHAIAHTGAISVVGVECGAGDGYTAHFALTEMSSALDYRVHLYDAWEVGALEGAYAGLAQARTARNLAAHEAHIAWHSGLLPDTLDATAPELVHWLHVDLNAGPLTSEVLDFFWERLAPGSVVLFDDYGWLSYADTRQAVDAFFTGRAGTLLPLPTGQAMYFRGL